VITQTESSSPNYDYLGPLNSFNVKAVIIPNTAAKPNVTTKQASYNPPNL
jgi:hypothetical protein